jgi:outer membrane protein
MRAVILVLAALLPAQAVGAEHRLRLDEASVRALRKNEAIVIERESAAAAAAGVDGAQGAYDQFVELEGSWNRLQDPSSAFSRSGVAPLGVPENQAGGVRLGIRQLLPTGGALSFRALGSRQTSEGTLGSPSPAYGTQVGLELRQPLLRDRTIDSARLSVRVATADREGAEASLRRVATETVAAVERAYWTLSAARLAVGVREEAVRLAQEQLVDTQARVEHGSAPHTELAQPRAELERRRGELLAGNEAESRAENALKLLILADGDALWSEHIAPAETVRVDPVKVDVAARIERALGGLPEVELAQAAARRRKAESSFASDGVRPSLDAVLSYDRYGLASTGFGAPSALLASQGGFERSFESLRDGDFNSAQLALVLGLPVHNSTARADAAVARHVERQAEAEIERVRKAIRAEVLDAAAALETAAQRVEAARAGREAAEIQLAAEKDRFDNGLSINFLVLTRQNDLSRARLDEISALTDYRTARTEMARAGGTLLEERGLYLEPVTH